MTQTGAAATGGAAPTGASAGTAGTAGATGATGGTGPGDPRLRVTEVKIPEKYKGEAWAKEVKSVDDLWEKMSGAQKLLGKDKVVVPGDNATTEEMAAFYTRMGRPETSEGYTFANVKGLEVVERNADMDSNMKKILFEEGVSKATGERIMSKLESAVYDNHKPMIEAEAARDTDFQTLATEVLGEDKPAAILAFKAVMRESLGEKAFLMSKIENMDNDVLLPMIVLSKNIHDKYTGESRVGIKPGDPVGLSGDLKSDYNSLSTQKLAVRNDANMPEHIKKTKLANLNLQMQKVGAKASDQGIDLFAKNV